MPVTQLTWGDPITLPPALMPSARPGRKHLHRRQCRCGRSRHRRIDSKSWLQHHAAGTDRLHQNLQSSCPESNFESTTANQPRSQVQAVGTATFNGSKFSSSLQHFRTRQLVANWPALTSRGTVQRILIKIPTGVGVYTLSAMIFMSSKSAESYINFNSSAETNPSFLTLLFREQQPGPGWRPQPHGLHIPTRSALPHPGYPYCDSHVCYSADRGCRHRCELHPESVSVYVQFGRICPAKSGRRRVRCDEYCCDVHGPITGRKVI